MMYVDEGKNDAISILMLFNIASRERGDNGQVFTVQAFTTQFECHIFAC